MDKDWIPTKKHLKKFCDRTTDGNSLLYGCYQNNICIYWNYKAYSLQKKNLKEKNYTRFFFKKKDRNVKQLALLWFSEDRIEENDYDEFSDVSSINGSIQSECDENEFKIQTITEKIKNEKNEYRFINKCGQRPIRVCVNPLHIDIIKKKE